MFSREFKRSFSSGSGISFANVNYTSNDSLIKRITITRLDQSPTDKYYRDCLNIECIATPEGETLADHIAIATGSVKLWKGQSIEENALRRNGKCQFYTKYTNADELKQLVNVLHDTLHHGAPIIDETMRNQLLVDIDHIKVYSDDIHAFILAQADVNIERGKALARQYYKEYGYRQVLWVLAEHFKQKDLFEDAVEMYEAIPNSNRQYADACLQLRSIYLQQLTANQAGAITLTLEEIQTIREKLLQLSLLAGDHQFSTAMFYELAGYGLVTYAPEIKLNGNPETYIYLSQQMAQLNEEKRKLQAEIAQLKKQMLIVSDAKHFLDKPAAGSGAVQQSSILPISTPTASKPPESLYTASSPVLYAQPSSGNSADTSTAALVKLDVDKKHQSAF